MTQSLSPASANTDPNPSAMPMKRSDVQFTPDLNAGTSITFSTNMKTSAARPTAMAEMWWNGSVAHKTTVTKMMASMRFSTAENGPRPSGIDWLSFKSVPPREDCLSDWALPGAPTVSEGESSTASQADASPRPYIPMIRK